MRIMRWIMAIMALLALLYGCANSAPATTLGPPPWQDGEICEYDLLDRSGAVLGVASWSWRRTPEGWVQSYALTLGDRQDSSEVVLDADLSPLRSRLVRPGATHEATYDATQVVIVTTADDGGRSTKELRRPNNPIDNSASLQAQRALPLAEGYAGRYDNVIPSTGLVVPMQVRVVGAETLSVPAGTFQTWRVEMSAGSSRHDAWYTQEPPHLLVKYHNRSAGSQYQLRRWQPAAGADWRGGQGVVSQPPAAARTAPDWLSVGLAFFVQYPLMLLFPLVLGWWIRQRYGVGWGVYGIGALTMIASQVVHLPLNWALGLLGGGRGVALWPLPLMALVAGLSAGLCEELARWLMLRFAARRTRGWAAALQFGAGHGGIEAIFFGLLAALNMVGALAATLLGQNLPGMEQYWQNPWYLFVFAGLERVFAIAFHVAMAVLVMRAVMRRRLGYLLAAIAGHTILNFWAVWGSGVVGAAWTTLGLGLMGLASLALIARLREAMPAIDVPVPTQEGGHAS